MVAPANSPTLASEPIQRPAVNRLPWSARCSTVGVLFRISFSRYAWSRRTMIVALLFALPMLLVLLAMYFDPLDREAAAQGTDWQAEGEFLLFFTLIPHALIPLTALLYASGMIQDEIEEQTLTYLLVRPLPRWCIYTVKLLAVFALTAIIASVFTTLAYLTLQGTELNLWGEILVDRVWKTCCLFALSLSTYSALFGLVSLLVRKALMVGATYIFLFEVVFANMEFVVRRLTVIYYFRVLSCRWLGWSPSRWKIDLDLAPTAVTSILVLCLTSVVATVVAAALFTVREFRFKTPEGR